MQSTTETREQRGLALYREHASQIIKVSVGVYRVPSCSGGGYYRVHLEAGTCECPDFTHRAETCKHLVAATLADAKRRCRRHSQQEISRRPSRNRRDHGWGTDTPERPSVVPERRDGSLRGVRTTREVLDRVAERLGV